MTRNSLWATESEGLWLQALEGYDAVVRRQPSRVLPELDRWYREVLPVSIRGRNPGYVTLDELARLTEWKMARGIWRARNLAFVRGNDPSVVQSASERAIAAIPGLRAPIAALTELAGVGPATASGVLSAAAPEHYPFFDDLVARQIPGLGPVDFTPAYYVRYAEAIRERAASLGAAWSPTLIERALWAHSGGKAGAL